MNAATTTRKNARKEVVYAYTSKKTKTWLQRKYKKAKTDGSFSAWFDSWVKTQIEFEKAMKHTAKKA